MIKMPRAAPTGNKTTVKFTTNHSGRNTCTTLTCGFWLDLWTETSIYPRGPGRIKFRWFDIDGLSLLFKILNRYKEATILFVDWHLFDHKSSDDRFIFPGNCVLLHMKQSHFPFDKNNNVNFPSWKNILWSATDQTMEHFQSSYSYMDERFNSCYFIPVTMTMCESEIIFG